MADQTRTTGALTSQTKNTGSLSTATRTTGALTSLPTASRDLTWDEATFTWDSATTQTWDEPQIRAVQTRTTGTLTSQTKS